MSKNIKELIREEYVKCAKDPVYFFKKYCYIQHPKRGKILFDLYPFQEDVEILHIIINRPSGKMKTQENNSQFFLFFLFLAVLLQMKVDF